jgi:hypothetical protein
MIISAGPASHTAMLPPRLICALLFLILCSATPGHALAQDGREQRWDIQPTEHFDIYYQSQQRSHVDAVAREAERAYVRVSYALRHELAEKMPLILVREDRDLPRNEEEARALVTASRAPERDHLLLSAETFEKRPGSVLAHELTHQFLFELLPQADRDAPWVSEALADHHGGLWDSSELVKVRDALVHGSVPAVEDLTASDRHWGHVVFDFVAAEYGAQGIRQYLAALRDAPTVRSDAIRVAFGVSARDFNAAFQRYVRTRFGDRQDNPAVRR